MPAVAAGAGSAPGSPSAAPDGIHSAAATIRTASPARAGGTRCLRRCFPAARSSWALSAANASASSDAVPGRPRPRSGSRAVPDPSMSTFRALIRPWTRPAESAASSADPQLREDRVRSGAGDASGGEKLVQGAAPDETGRNEPAPLPLPRLVGGNDARVVERRAGSLLIQEPALVLRTREVAPLQQAQRHGALERDLLSLVDRSAGSATDQPADPEPSDDRSRLRRPHRLRG